MKRRSFLKTLALTTPSIYLASFPAMSDSNSRVFKINLSSPGRFSFYIDYSELSSTGQHIFYVTRTHGTQGNVSVNFNSFGDAHTTVSGTISFLNGESGIKSFTVDVPSKENGDHRIYAQLSSPTGGAVLHNGTKTIAYGVIDDNTIAADSDAVFFDTDSGVNGNGTQTSPYNNIYDAITNVGAKRYIYGKGVFTPSEAITVDGGSSGSGIRVPASRSSELTRLYIRNWPGATLTITGNGISGHFGFYTSSSENFHTYRGLTFTSLSMTGLNTSCFSIFYHYGGSSSINIELCSSNDINGGLANVGAYMLWGVDGGKVWRCTSNNIQREGDNTNLNTAGFLSFDGKNLSIQRSEFSNSNKALYHKRVGTVGDVTTAFKFNSTSTPEGASYRASGGGDVGHSYAIIQGNLFTNALLGGVRHSPGLGQSSTLVNKSMYINNNVFVSCGAGTVGAIFGERWFENVIFNNIFLNCRSTWVDKTDNTAIKSPIEYADYNNDFGTTLISRRYVLSGTGYSTAADLPDPLGNNDTQVNPEFTNALEGVYTLATGSNSIGAGVDGTNQGIFLLNIEIVGVNGILVRPSRVTDLQVS